MALIVLCRVLNYILELEFKNIVKCRETNYDISIWYVSIVIIDSADSVKFIKYVLEAL
jgi:hypothetical protein